MSCRILGICGSLQRGSSNQALLECAAANAPPGSELRLYDGLRALPHFDPDLERAGAPNEVRRLREAVASSDALLIATPEYGHSLPGSLKNAIDWLIGSGELEGKLIAITSAVPAAYRGRLGLQALRVTLQAVSARVPFDEPIVKGSGLEQAVRTLLETLVDAARGPARSDH